MDVGILFGLLVKLAIVEVPHLHDGSEKNNKYLEGIHQMAEIYVDVGEEGALYSSDIDPIILSVIGYEESRNRPNSPDGDCYFTMNREKKCNSFGPMQISKIMPWYLKNLDPDYWEGVTEASLRQPDENVEAAYFLLNHYKKECKGGGLAHMFGNYMGGKCFKGAIAPGKKRCHIAKAMGESIGIKMPECPASAMDSKTKNLVKSLKTGL